MAAHGSTGGIGIQPRQRELLGLLLALISTSLLLSAAVNARLVGGGGDGSTSVFGGGPWSDTGLELTVKAFAMSQTPLQALVLTGALVLVGQGAWSAVGVSARIARALLAVVGVVVGVAAAYGALLVGFDDQATGGPGVWFPGTSFDARLSATLLGAVVAATGLVVARLAFGLLPVGGGDPGEPVEGQPPVPAGDRTAP